MNRKIILFLVTGILFLNLLKSCSGRIDIDNKVRLKPTSNEKLNLGKVFKIIQLENTEESTLETIRKTAIDLKNNRIFVLSDFNIYIFDAKGKYITKLKKGRGPGEISRIISFSLNKEKKIIYAAANSGKS